MDAAEQVAPTADRIDDALLDDLRAIVAGPDRERMKLLEERITEIEHLAGDHEAMVAAVSPILGDAIRRQVHEDRDAMVESLYPIIGQLISRAVAEAIRDLARNIDRRMRTSFSPAYYLRRLQARARGVSDAELALRDALPFRVAELFLIHRESGLLLLHLSREQPSPSVAEDNSDLISSMLTAIRDFAQDAFGQEQQGGLDEIQYGDRRILIEALQHIYLAVVVDGIEPAGFRAKLRERAIEVQNAYVEVLKAYNGDASQFEAVRPDLAGLLEEGPAGDQAADLSPSQKRIALGLAVVLLLCLVGACLGGALWAGNALKRPAYVVIVTATPGSTEMPTTTPTLAPTLAPTQAPTHPPVATVTLTTMPAATPTTAPTATPTATPTTTLAPTANRTTGPAPSAQVIVVANLRAEPGLDSPILGRAPAGGIYTVLGRDPTGGWVQVCCTVRGDAAWLAAALATISGSMESVPIVGEE